MDLEENLAKDTIKRCLLTSKDLREKEINVEDDEEEVKQHQDND